MVLGSGYKGALQLDIVKFIFFIRSANWCRNKIFASYAAYKLFNLSGLTTLFKVALVAKAEFILILVIGRE